jgi:hypothetical protein
MSTRPKQKALTPAMWRVLRYTAAHGCAAKIGGPWLEVARLLEREGFLELRDCLGGYCAARLTPAANAHVSARWEFPPSNESLVGAYLVMSAGPRHLWVFGSR